MESLDFLNHRIASLSERLSAEAKVREAQFRRLEALLSLGRLERMETVVSSVFYGFSGLAHVIMNHYSHL